MRNFDKDKNIREGRLVVETQKTKEIVSMPLSPRLKKLFSSINYHPLFISNQKYNNALKKIGKATKTGELSSHMARHTFVVMCASSGISQEVTARLMGHADLKSTRVYYKLNNPRIDKELKKLG